jgi:hypothetical protein
MSVTLREGCRLSVPENGMPRDIFIPKKNEVTGKLEKVAE